MPKPKGKKKYSPKQKITGADFKKLKRRKKTTKKRG